MHEGEGNTKKHHMRGALKLKRGMPRGKAVKSRVRYLVEKKPRIY